MVKRSRVLSIFIQSLTFFVLLQKITANLLLWITSSLLAMVNGQGYMPMGKLRYKTILSLCK